MNDINPADAVDLSQLKAQMQTSATAAIAWSLQPTIFPMKHDGVEGIVPCIELTFSLSNGTPTTPVALPPDIIVGLISGLSTWLAQIQGNQARPGPPPEADLVAEPMRPGRANKPRVKKGG